jgi:hypothetical protein
MRAREALIELYKQWRGWTEAEGEAIRLAAWTRVDQCQAAKTKLQPLIAHASEQAHRDAADPPSQVESNEAFFRGILNELIQLERGNLELLASHRQRAEREKESLNRVSRNLRQLHRSYVADRALSEHWQSYS